MIKHNTLSKAIVVSKDATNITYCFSKSYEAMKGYTYYWCHEPKNPKGDDGANNINNLPQVPPKGFELVTSL